jgi:hypothetical protein
MNKTLSTQSLASGQGRLLSLTRALPRSLSLSLSGSGPPPFVYVEGWLGIGSLDVFRQPGLSVRQSHD